jgi:ArsR family transcriptional regulator, zinc-responsive transcriptional repressor
MNVFAVPNVTAVRTVDWQSTAGSVDRVDQVGRMDRVDWRRLEAASELLKALAAPVRLAVLVGLDGGPRCVHELVDALQASQPLVSQHLRVLRAAGLVTAQRRGREVAYQLTDEHVRHIVQQAIRHTGEGRS